jgi:phage terminase large subunit
LDYNPTSEFWAHTELIGNKNTDFIILTYKDNEALEPAIVKEIEAAKEKGKVSEYWRNWWQVYGLGEIGSLQGVVFNNWSDIDFVPNEAKLLGYGMDFGYTNDPTTLTAIYSYNNEIILDELIYRTGLTNSDIANLAKPLIKNEPIYADSSEPKSITELQRAGLRMVGATKGADSIMHGLQLMQGQYFRITKRSTNLINEFRNYTWATDKNGMTINKPIDAHNHAIDGIRYYFLSKNKFTGKYYASI